MFPASANWLGEREILWTGCFNKARFHLLEFQLFRIKIWKKKKKIQPLGDWTKTCTSENDTEPPHNQRRQTQGTVWALSKSKCWKLQFFIGRLYLFPACMIASESMASSFQDFPAENFVRCSPDDSHLVLETIFSCFYFSTRSWRAPAICVVDISLPLAPLGRSSTRHFLGAEPAHHSSFRVFHTAKLQHSWDWQQQFLSPWSQIMESKQAKENQTHSSSSECLQGHSQAGLGKGLMIWTLKA